MYEASMTYMYMYMYLYILHCTAEVESAGPLLESGAVKHAVYSDLGVDSVSITLAVAACSTV